jgi:hypothetical protein
MHGQMIMGNDIINIPPHDFKPPPRYFRLYGIEEQNFKKGDLWHNIHIMNFHPAIL